MEQITLFDYIRKPYKIDKPIRLISLFSGYDSQAMSLKKLGADFEHYKAVEIDKYAIASLNAVHGTNFEPIDICDVHGKDLEIVDKDKYEYIMTYSYPCTDISRAGEQAGFEKGSGTRSSLLWEVERILLELNELDTLPHILLMENVAALVDEKYKSGYRKWIDVLDRLGYTTYSQILNAFDYGIPQHRERVIALSLLGDYNYKFPRPIELTKCIEDFYEELTEEQALKLVVKSEKAHALLVELDENGELE